MITVGITGGIGSGKTTVCKVWETLGAKIFNADQEAKMLMASDPDVVRAIKKTFGEQAYFADGELNRQYLSQEAFRKGRVKELNNIVHPAVRRKFAEDTEVARESGVQLFVKEAALMDVESRSDGLDYVVVVAGELENRIERVIARDGVDRQSVMDRVNKQPDYEALERLGDFVIHNDGSHDELKDASEALYKQLLELSGRPAND